VLLIFLESAKTFIHVFTDCSGKDLHDLGILGHSLQAT